MSDQKEDIRSRIDLVDLIQEYVPLKQAGSVSWKGLCPFHAEKTPSFHVSRDRQIWHCFGCNEGGDCFAFVMRMEGMDFPEALRHLGAKVGIEVARFSSAESNEKQRLVAANTFAAGYYRKVLTDAASAADARAYVARRGIPEELAQAFGLGVAPDAWDALAQAFVKRGIPETDGERAGLLMRRRQGSGFIDRFRRRLMIPLRDAQGSVVGFTGRVFAEAALGSRLSAESSAERRAPNAESAGPKYLNSPETPVYHKGSMLFGLDLAKKAIREAGRVIIVEGQMDVIASHKAGVANIVASSGTALTEAQLALLKRYASTIVFSFDADAAGFKAAQRGITLARQAGFDVRVAVLPASAGKDPDEAVQKDPRLWRDAVQRTVPIMQYFIDRAVAGRNLNDVDDKRAISSFLLPEFAHMSDVVEREHWLQAVADLLRTDLAVLRQSIQRPQASPPTPLPSRGEGGSPPASPYTSAERARVRTREDQSLELLLGLFINLNEFRALIAERLPPSGLPADARIRGLYAPAVSLYDRERSSPAAPSDLFERLRRQLQALPEPERTSETSLLDAAVLQAERLVEDQPPAAVAGHVRQLIEAVASSEVRRRRKALEQDIRRAESAGNKEEVQRLLESLNRLMS